MSLPPPLNLNISTFNTTGLRSCLACRNTNLQQSGLSAKLLNPELPWPCHHATPSTSLTAGLGSVAELQNPTSSTTKCLCPRLLWPCHHLSTSTSPPSTSTLGLRNRLDCRNPNLQQSGLRAKLLNPKLPWPCHHATPSAPCRTPLLQLSRAYVLGCHGLANFSHPQHLQLQHLQLA